MILSLCQYNDGELVDDVFDLIYKVVAEKHGIKPEDLEFEDEHGDSYNKEEFQDEINFLYDELEGVLIQHLND